MTTFVKQCAGILGCLALFATAAFAAETSKSILLLNGKDLTGWRTNKGKKETPWKFGKAALDPENPAKLKVEGSGTELVSSSKSVNITTEAEFGDCQLDLEFMVAQHSNSGVKLMNIYEVQIFDSFGKAAPDNEDCGAIYRERAPKVNSARKPGEWQTLAIDFRAPRFDASGKKIANAKFVKVVLNGLVVQENVELEHGTNVSRNAPERSRAPLLLQGDHGPVAFRNIRITPLN